MSRRGKIRERSKFNINKDKFNENFDRIFSKKENEKPIKSYKVQCGKCNKIYTANYIPIKCTFCYCENLFIEEVENE